MKTMKWITIAGAMAFLSGCAHGGAELNQKVANESAIQNRDDLRQEASENLNQAQLDPSKKAELQQIREKLNAQESQIWKETLQLRAVLVKDLLAKKYNPAEVDKIKGRMWDLEQKRLTLIYNAIDDANKILGHFTPEDKFMIDEFFDHDIRR